MIVTEKVELESRGRGEIIDVTPRVVEMLKGKGLREGTATLFISHSTAALTTMEYEPGLISDMQRLLERLVPEEGGYEHNRRWGDDNGHAHLRASLLGASLVVPFSQGSLVLGTWQQIVMIDFDVRPRRRQVVIQLAGE